MSFENTNNNKPHVVIIGAGFGGLRATQELAGDSVRITLLDQKNYHLFQPLLYQVATAGLSPEDIAKPVRAILRNQKNVEFHMAKVCDIDFDGKQVHTTTISLTYDYLVIAAGGRNNYFGIESVLKNGFGMKTLDEAIVLRNHILQMFELAEQEKSADKRRAMLTFMVVGGGPTGVEYAGALSELVYQVLTKDYPTLNFKEVRIILAEAGNCLLPAMPDELREATGKILWDKHVEVRFGAVVTDYDGEVVAFKGGEIVPARTLIWAAGISAANIVQIIQLPKSSGGRIAVLPTLQVPERPDVFVIGDAAFFKVNEQPLPMTAVVALQQAALTAKNIQHLIKNEQLEEYIFNDIGSMATIGRNAAVCNIGSWRTYGFIAWLLWLIVHILRLIGFRERLAILLKWAWDYLFYDKAVRLIIK